jgi:hypothetical protein
MIIVFGWDMLLHRFEGSWSPTFSRSNGLNEIEKDRDEDFK